MSPIFYSKFIWADWLLDQPLRRCSPEARGLWIDMLALSVRSEPVGVLADGGTVLGVSDIARAAGLRKPTAERLIAELERNNVFSRDDRGAIYSRRVVREHRTRQSNKANGARGGNPQLTAKTAPAPDNPHKLEVKSQESEVTEPKVTEQHRAPLLRAVEVMGTTIDALHRKMAWMAFDYTFANWLEEGCDAERDVWPTIAALSAKLGKIPASPAYFTDAVREARDRRRGQGAPRHRTLGAPYLASTATIPRTGTVAHIDPQLEADRRDAFARDGVWSTAWGPKPDAPKPESESTAPPPP
jgi:IclR helix-turn-helix domain